jgi:FKBP-type peptidyl-prolyl cis-trans isomerase FklB
MKTRIIALAISFLFIGGVQVQAQKEDKKSKKIKGAPMNNQDSLSYALGVSIGKNLLQAGVKELNTEMLGNAMKAALAGADLAMNEEQCNMLIQQELGKIAEAKSAEARKGGEDFLAKNKSESGVVTTPSGLQYRTNVEGSGLNPDENDEVTVHYEGKLIDGTIFDSSIKRGEPATFGLNQVIPGWTEGLQLMKEGGKTTFFIPQQLAYGQQDMGTIPAYSTLIFEVELIKVNKVD